MIQKMAVNLPFEVTTVFVCDICGGERQHPFEQLSQQLSEHPESKLEQPDVKSGDVVAISSPYGSTIVRNRCTVARLFYSQPGKPVGFLISDNPNRPWPHTLCITLLEEFADGMGTISEMTYGEFRLRRDVSPYILQKAGLLPTPKPPMFISRLFLGWRKNS